MSKERKAERKREHEAAVEREYEERNSREREFRDRFGALEARLEELGIDPFLLGEYLAEKEAVRLSYGHR